MKPNILVIGSTNSDMIIKVPHLPAPGETVLGGEFSIAQGGKGANQAVAAARAGGKVTFISCIGNDSLGKKSLEGLGNEGIDVSSIKIIAGYSSGVALINVAESGENSISVAPGANSMLLPVDIDQLEETIKTAGIILIQLEIPLDTVKCVIRMAKKHQIPVILNPAPALKLDSTLLSSVDYITPNEQEAATIAGLDDVGQNYKILALALRQMGAKTVIITLGEKGAFFSSTDGDGIVAGYTVKAVDTTAAGDTFNGYLAAALARGNELESAIRFANKAASLSVTKLGAQPSIPTLSEIESNIIITTL